MRQSDQDFIKWVEAHEVWYEKQSGRWGLLLTLCKFLSLCASIISIVVAAAVSKDNFEIYGRWLIVVASALTALSTETLSQMKVREMEALREEGHIEASAILAHVRQKFIEYEGDDRKLNDLKDDTRRKINTLEKRQHTKHIFIESKHVADKSPSSN